MVLILAILLISTLLGGLSVRLLGRRSSSIRLPLIFAGSFLFSITIIHILPEVFAISEYPMRIGLFVLIGFFFQQFLEYFTSGIEHGHFHQHAHTKSSSQISLLIALIIHSLLEGALLTHHSPFHDQHESHSLLLGIILHKAPAAFALVATLKQDGTFTPRIWTYLILFSLASPVGLILSDQLIAYSPDLLIYLFAIVSGSFLHISTTIFVESSPNHHFGLKKFLISIVGALVAIAAEYFM